MVRPVTLSQLKIGDVVWKKNYNADKFSNLFTDPFTVTAIEGVTISICDKEGQTSACGIHQLKRGGPKIKIAREGVDIIKKAASIQTETELTKPAFDESDLRQWRDAVMNEGVMTRSKKRALEKMDGVIGTNDNKEPKHENQRVLRDIRENIAYRRQHNCELNILQDSAEDSDTFPKWQEEW
ncbi:hypothetical protein FOZ61_000871 [Perkinsus olseni]|uniref:Uncharacterized protein n=1 Tax=Perkinsus olseni TaxID=32597 RepID=A0A7J6KVQ8_PEROL|nr:hypothetical protein FOZ61_000871 [Perkinsus olseni]KAF4650679.1 hypothetical protein FOL46_000798 [Perkinsus olseni]